MPAILARIAASLAQHGFARNVKRGAPLKHAQDGELYRSASKRGTAPQFLPYE
jgi:hypothetical protein